MIGDFLKRRADILERERKKRLKKLSAQQALRLEESLLSSQLIRRRRRKRFEDTPVCLAHSLKRKA